LLELAKKSCSVTTQNSSLSHDEFGVVMRWIAANAPDTIQENDHVTVGPIGIGMTLFVTLCVFPDDFVKSGLFQEN
jgi:hypothetical protein